MRMVRSVLLGSAAGLVAVTAGQAADLPVKAQPVQYVKVCNLYGAGFYYMPGTDMCIKIGGWVRAEIADGTNGNITWGPFNGNLNNRTTSNVAMRARGYITADAREQTAYGVARAYIAAGVATNDVGLQVAGLADSINRAYVQFAGFTGGLAQSFYDFYSVPAMTYRGGYFPASDTGDPGWWVFGYTAQFGGGFSATLSAEARRTTQIIDGNCASSGNGGSFGAASTANVTPTCGATNPGGYPTAAAVAGATASGGVASVAPGVGAYGGQQVPDIVANLRLDQAWGAAQIMGAYHEVNAQYYGTAATSAPNIASGSGPSAAAGWAAGAGLKINFPMIAPGDYFQSQFNYTQGALRYLFFTPNSNWGNVNGNQEAFGVLSDCVYGGSLAAPTSQTGCQLTTAWGVNAGYEHYWTPNWHQSVFGNYYVVDYNTSANAMLCADTGFGTGSGATAAAAAGCNMNWSTWGVGTRLQWDVTKSFYIGVEGLYQHLQSATTNTAGTLNANYLPIAQNTLLASQTESGADNWTVTLRMHKDFLP